MVAVMYCLTGCQPNSEDVVELFLLASSGSDELNHTQRAFDSYSKLVVLHRICILGGCNSRSMRYKCHTCGRNHTMTKSSARPQTHLTTLSPSLHPYTHLSLVCTLALSVISQQPQYHACAHSIISCAVGGVWRSAAVKSRCLCCRLLASSQAVC